MADQFTPPPVSSWQGPAQAASGTFTPPPPSAWQGIANPDPNYKPPSPTLPPSTGDIIGQWLPYVGAAGATALTGGGALPAIGAAMLGGAAGSIPKQLMMEKPPQSVGEFTTGIGNDALEQGANETGGRFINAALGRIFSRAANPEQLYQSALKPPPGAGIEANQRIVQAGLKEGIPVDPEKWATDWQKLNSQIDGIIKSNPNSGGTIDPKKITVGLDNLKAKWASGSGDPQFAKAISQVKQDFELRYPRPLTPEQAQDVKKQIYQEIRNAKQSYFSSPSAPLSLDAKAELASALRQELEQRYPQIASLNKREGALIDLEKSLERFAAREGNKQITPYFMPVAAGALLGAGAGGYGGAGAGAAIGGLATNLLRSAFEDPTIKSKIAIALYKAGGTPVGKAAKMLGPYVAPNTIRLGEGLLTNGMPEPPR